MAYKSRPRSDDFPALARDPKGKRRARPESRGIPLQYAPGVVLNLTLTGDGIITSIYTLPITIGSENQIFPVQLDIGSSDTWIASSLCSSDPCTSYSSPKYDPSKSTSSMDTGELYKMDYLEGSADGNVWWDTVSVGPFEIGNQAFAAVDSVTDEPLSSEFTGLLALALPLSSVIASELTPTNGNSPDGAPIISNIFGLGSDSPEEHYFSLLLERPGMDRVPSMFGIGTHPSDVVQRVSMSGSNWVQDLQFNEVSEYQQGTLFWALPVTGLTANVNGNALDIPLGRSDANPDEVYPIGVFDTGVPFILARKDVVDAFYGAYGIGPGSDGSYYVPCTTPVNMSITIGSQTFPIHPLDVTYSSPAVQDSTYCISAFQAHDDLTHADLVLGAAFMRNVYTVLSYNRYGSVASANLTIPSSQPAMALLSITNISQAMDEFNIVRVQHQPLPSSSGGGGKNEPTPGRSGGNTSTGSSRHHHDLNLLWILAGVLGAGVLLILLFLARRHFRARKFELVFGNASPRLDAAAGEGKDDTAIALGVLPSRKKSRRKHSEVRPDDADYKDTLGSSTIGFAGANAWHNPTRPSSIGGMASFTTSTNSTRVGEWVEPLDYMDVAGAGEFGDYRHSTARASSLGSINEVDAAAGAVHTRGRSGTGSGSLSASTRSQSHLPRSRSRGPIHPSYSHTNSMPLSSSISSAGPGYPTPLVVDTSATGILTAIPMAHEITPEALSSARYFRGISSPLVRRESAYESMGTPIVEIGPSNGNRAVDSVAADDRMEVEDSPYREDQHHDYVAEPPPRPELSLTAEASRSENRDTVHE